MASPITPILSLQKAESVLARAGELWGVTPADIRGPQRTHHVREARMLAAVVLREMRHSYPDIGYAIFRHNSTVQYLCKSAPERIRILAGVMMAERRGVAAA